MTTSYHYCCVKIEYLKKNNLVLILSNYTPKRIKWQHLKNIFALASALLCHSRTRPNSKIVAPPPWQILHTPMSKHGLFNLMSTL